MQISVAGNGLSTSMADAMNSIIAVAARGSIRPQMFSSTP